MTRPALFMRRARLIEWLEPLGFSERQIDAMIEAGTLKRRYLNIYGKKKSRAHYRRDEVAKAIGIEEPTS